MEWNTLNNLPDRQGSDLLLTIRDFNTMECHVVTGKFYPEIKPSMSTFGYPLSFLVTISVNYPFEIIAWMEKPEPYNPEIKKETE